MGQTYPNKPGGSDHNPDHYKAVFNGQPIMVVDVMEIFASDDAHKSQAIKYLLRAGKKEGQSYLKDMGKALWWCARAVLFNGGVIDLPLNAHGKVKINGVRVPDVVGK